MKTIGFNQVFRQSPNPEGFQTRSQNFIGFRTILTRTNTNDKFIDFKNSFELKRRVLVRFFGSIYKLFDLQTCEKVMLIRCLLVRKN